MKSATDANEDGISLIHDCRVGDLVNLQTRIKELEKENAELKTKLWFQKGLYDTANEQLTKLKAVMQNDCMCPHDDNWDCNYYYDGCCGKERTLEESR